MSNLRPAQTCTHYWLYKQGKEVWNRWAHEHVYKTPNTHANNGRPNFIGRCLNKLCNVSAAAESKGFPLGEGGIPNIYNAQISALKEFQSLQPFSPHEKEEIEKKMLKECQDWQSQNPEINGVMPPSFESLTAEMGFGSGVQWDEKVNFNGYVFPSFTYFRGSTFEEHADFGMSVFVIEGNFSDVQFKSGVNFRASIFDDIIFEDTHFNYAFFDFGLFNNRTDFSPKFIREATFTSSYFKMKPNFKRINFESVNFSYCLFDDGVNFLDCSVDKRLLLNGAIFEGKADFSRSRLECETDLKRTNFKDDLDFSYSIFKERVNFSETKFEGYSSFKETTFEKLPYVHGIEINGFLEFFGATWPKPQESDDPVEDMGSYAQIKRQMERLNRHDQEILFFKEELKCRAESLKRKASEEIKGKMWLPKLRNKHYRQSRFIELYEYHADCGESIAKPLNLLLITFVLFTGLYVSWAKDGASNLQEAIYLSFKHSFPFIPSNIKHYNDVVSQTFASGWIADFLFPFFSATQSLISILLLFLMGLAMRNHLRIK